MISLNTIEDNRIWLCVKRFTFTCFLSILEIGGLAPRHGARRGLVVGSWCRGSAPEMAMLTEDLAEVRRQMKRRDDEPGATCKRHLKCLISF